MLILWKTNGKSAKSQIHGLRMNRGSLIGSQSEKDGYAEHSRHGEKRSTMPLWRLKMRCRRCGTAERHPDAGVLCGVCFHFEVGVRTALRDSLFSDGPTGDVEVWRRQIPEEDL